MSLQEWLKNGWLVEHKSSPEEIADLLSVADRDLHDSQAEGISTDWRLNIAYNAALQLATIALAASGYRAAREAHHYRTLHSLALTLGLQKLQVAKLDKFRVKRNISDYERAFMTSEKEAEEMLALAKELRERVLKWLRDNHPELCERR
jgi:hypothetical protein